MLTENRAKILELSGKASTCLDIGGYHRQLNTATHVLDILPYGSRFTGYAHNPETPERFNAGTWLVHDMCCTQWNYPDKYFEFCTCMGTLEDIRDPIGVVKELCRVARAGYIECPAPYTELLMNPGGGLVGNAHHRWLVQLDSPEIIFRVKPHDLIQRSRYIKYTKFHKVNFENHGLFWKDYITAREEIFDIGEYIDSNLEKTKTLITFAPLDQILGKLSRVFSPPDKTEFKQPDHGQDGIKYPYF